MPIIIAGHVDFVPERVEELIMAAQPVIAEARRKPGYISYTWSIDPAIPGRVHAFGEWESEAALQSHFDDIYSKMGAVFASGILSADVRKYRYDVVEPVRDPTGRPRADFFTVEP